MKNTQKVLLSGASIVTAEKARQGALLIEGNKISRIWYADDKGNAEYNGKEVQIASIAREILKDNPDTTLEDLSGKVLMAGGIDAHVHFREPGMIQKADMASESKAALLGGVTSFIDMPNTIPPTTTKEALEQKCELAKGRCYANWGFHIGADNANAGMLTDWLEDGSRRKFAGVKVFMGSSTGNMLVDNGAALDKLFGISAARVLIHSEDESIIKANLEKAKAMFGEDIPMKEHENIRSRQACIRSTAKALELAMRHGTKLHVCHVSTSEEVDMIRTAKQYNPEITAETSSNYLWFCDDDYERLGSKMKCNPAIKTARDRDALRKDLKDGIIETIGSDHAPHLLKEKDRPYLTCPSGMPSIQQEISVLLTVAAKEQIALTTIASVISEKAAAMFGFDRRGQVREGWYADLIVIDPDMEFIVGESDRGAAIRRCASQRHGGGRLS